MLPIWICLLLCFRGKCVSGWSTSVVLQVQSQMKEGSSTCLAFSSVINALVVEGHLLWQRGEAVTSLGKNL